VLETSALREPIEFVAGGDDVIAGLSTAVIGMSAGEKKRIHVAPEQAFGYRDQRLQQTVPRIAVPERLSDGDQLTVTPTRSTGTEYDTAKNTKKVSKVPLETATYTAKVVYMDGIQEYNLSLTPAKPTQRDGDSPPYLLSQSPTFEWKYPPP